MFRFVLLAFAIHFVSCNNNRQQPIESNFLNDTSLKIIVTGLPDLESITQLNFLAKKYGFEYYPIGCVLPKSQRDSTQAVNSSTYKILERRFGKTWKKNFNSELDTIKSIRQQADSILKSRFHNKFDYYYYLVTRDSAKNRYQVKLYSKESSNNKVELIVHYKIAIVLGQDLTFQIWSTSEKL